MKPRFATSVTKLESFRRYRDQVTESDTKDRLIERITGLAKPTFKTDVGSAFHKLCEGVTPNEVEIGKFVELYHHNGMETVFVRFDWSAWETILEFRKTNPFRAVEQKVSKVYEFPSFNLFVGGRVDGLGSGVSEIKTINMDPDMVLKGVPVWWTDYQRSHQWRFFAEMLESPVFKYHLFEVTSDRGLTSVKRHDDVVLHWHETDLMKINQLMEQFVDFCIDNRLETYITPKFKR